MIIAIIKNDIILDMIMAESLEIAQEAIDMTYPESETMDLTENPNNIGINWIKINGEWYPPEGIN